MNKELLNVCNKTYFGDAPNCWLQGAILPVPKKKDLSIASNYREITLFSSVHKMYNKMFLNRIRPILDEKLRTNQNGFRPGRSTFTQILTLRRIIEGVKSKTLPAVMIFVDFHEAFDSIHRGKLMDILKAYGILLETKKLKYLNFIFTKFFYIFYIISYLMMIYNISKSSVKTKIRILSCFYDSQF